MRMPIGVSSLLICQGILVALSVSPASGSSDPVSSEHSTIACVYYYTGSNNEDPCWQAGWYDHEQFKSWFTRWDLIRRWDFQPRVQTAITDAPNLTTERFLSDASYAGLLDLDSHGDAEGVILECYLTRTARDLALEYLRKPREQGGAGFDLVDVEPEDVAGEVFGQVAYTIVLTNLGIIKRVRIPDPGAFINLAYCYSCQSTSNWPPGALVLCQQQTDHNCACRFFIYQALNCVPPRFQHKTPRVGTAYHYWDAEVGDPCNSSLVGYSGNLDWQVSCDASCVPTTALFETAGASAEAVWAVTNTESNIDSIGVVGYLSSSDWPHTSELVATQPANGGYGLRRFYRFDNLDLTRYALVQVFAADRHGVDITYSGPCPVRGESPDLGALEVVNSRFYDLGAVTEETTRTPPRARDRGGAPKGEEDILPERGAHLLVYSSDSVLLARAASYYTGRTVEGVSLEVSAHLGSGTVADIRVALANVIGRNVAWNSYCAQHPEECSGIVFPEVPYLLLVGDSNPAVVDAYYFADSFLRCGRPVCASDAIIADLDADWMEDAIVLRIPCTTIAELNNLLATSDRYQQSFFKKGVLLIGAFNQNGNDDRPRRLMGVYDGVLEEMRHGRRWLVEKHYGFSPGVYDPSAEAKEQAFVDAVNDGAGWIVGWDYETSWATWPGRFLTHLDFDIGRLDRQQSVVALLPGCLMGSEQLDDATYHDGWPTKIHQLMFRNPSQGTSIACAVSHMDAGYDIQHETWAELLAAEVAIAPTGKTWARIVRDAKVRFRVMYPELFSRSWKEFLAGVSVHGGLVGKPGPGSTGHPPKGPGLPISDGLASGRPLHVATCNGDAVCLELKGIGKEVSLVQVVDAGGREITRIQEGEMEGASGRLVWQGRDSNGRRVARGVYFIRVRLKSGEVLSEKVAIVSR